MPMDSGEPIPLEMFKGEPIVLMSSEEAKKGENDAENGNVIENGDQEKQ